MIKVGVNEQFSITAALVDEDSMGHGLVVNYVIEDAGGAYVDGGVLDENLMHNGIYCKYVSLASPGKYRVFYESVGYPTGVEDVTVSQDTLAELVKQNRQGNIAVKNILAISDILARNVAVGKTNYIIIYVKRDSDLDWSSPVSEKRIYAHYKNLGDDNPYYMGEQ